MDFPRLSDRGEIPTFVSHVHFRKCMGMLRNCADTESFNKRTEYLLV